MILKGLVSLNSSELEEYQLLQLLRLVSPALPVGSFAYSQGLEGGVEQGWVKTEEDSVQWIIDILTNNLASLDLPALFWQLSALDCGDTGDFVNFNEIIFAYRETAEFRLESHQMGQALLRLLRDTHCHSEVKGGVRELLYETQFERIDWVSAFAVAAYNAQLNQQSALSGYAWAWCEAQVAAAIKLVPLGQTQGQRVLIRLISEIAELVRGLLADMPDKNNIGAISANLAIISSLHETQYSRLFRS